MRVLFSWLGRDELTFGKNRAGGPPLVEALAAAASTFDEIVLLSSHDEVASHGFVEKLNCAQLVTLVQSTLKSPVDYGQIHQQAVAAVERSRALYGSQVELAFFLNSGTPPMGAVWLLLGKSRYPAELLAWSTYNKRLEKVDVPFEISAEFVPALLQRTDAVLRESSMERAPRGAAFANIVHRCQHMQDLLEKAGRVALHNVPILLEGESGTGKEILARAIHSAGPRHAAPFIAVNCGAIPEHLAESEFFGHVKGAFTGAVEVRHGHFREASRGTLFLDEIGELPLRTQVALLRPLQEGHITPVGASKAIAVDVRVIAATHRSLIRDVADGKFREDLFYRLAVAVLKVPALRQREGDVSILVEHVLRDLNATNAAAGFRPRALSPAAKNRLLQHHWPGNVRELANTMRRAVVWSAEPLLQVKDIEDALLQTDDSSTRGPRTTRALGPGFDLDSLLHEIEQAYIAEALDRTMGKRGDAARMLGLKSHQVLRNRLKRRP